MTSSALANNMSRAQNMSFFISTLSNQTTWHVIIALIRTARLQRSSRWVGGLVAARCCHISSSNDAVPPTKSRHTFRVGDRPRWLLELSLTTSPYDAGSRRRSRSRRWRVIPAHVRHGADQAGILSNSVCKRTNVHQRHLSRSFHRAPST